jgi:uracil phosphoribosyltransferase
MSNVFESGHPMVRHKLALLRDVESGPKLFRELVAELASLMAYEATADLRLRQLMIATPMGRAVCESLDERIALVPVLRAGLGMVDPVLRVIPEAQVWHIGLYRDETDLKPVQYYSKHSVDGQTTLCMLLDPMLATGGSAIAACDILKQWRVARIKFLGLIAAPEGIGALQAAHPDVDVHVAAIDDRLNDIGYIVPGLGDAGDRLFGTA